MKRRITIKDIAAELSLSPATVSLVLSGKADSYRIASSTRLRVEEAAERLGYRPNQLAQAMRRGRSDTIGVVFPNISESYMNRVLNGIEDIAAERDVSLMIATSSFDYRIEARNIRTLLDRQVDGLILVPYAPFRGEHYSDAAIRDAVAGGTPVVAVDRTVPGVISSAVVGSDYRAASKATERLIETGCRRLAYVGFDLIITTLEDRLRGFRDAVANAGLEDAASEIILEERNPDSDDLRNRITELDDGSRLPDGFLVSTDGLALKLRSLLIERAGNAFGGNRDSCGENSRAAAASARRPALPIPKIARFGEDSPYFPTDMISVTQPHRTIGRLAMMKLMTLISGGGDSDGIEVVDMEVMG